MPFTFSIRAALRRSWSLFTERPWFYIFLTLVLMLLNATGQFSSHQQIFMSIVTSIASLMWTYVILSVSLAAVDGHTTSLRFKTMQAHFPTVRQFAKLFVISIVVALPIMIVGVVAFVGAFFGLLVPMAVFTFDTLVLMAVLFLGALYVSLRLSFAPLAFVDKNLSIGKSVRSSWRMTAGKKFWTILLVIIVCGALVMTGMFLLFVGILIAYPIVFLTIAQLYRALEGKQSISVENSNTNI